MLVFVARLQRYDLGLTEAALDLGGYPCPGIPQDPTAIPGPSHGFGCCSAGVPGIV